MSQSTQSPSQRKAASSIEKPPKPYDDFPLTPHASGKWQKKINGKVYYFGKWATVVNGVLTRVEGDGWADALKEYQRQAADLHAGRRPRIRHIVSNDDGDEPSGLTVADLCNRFLTAKLRKRQSGELGDRMFCDYKEITDMLVREFGSKRLVDDLAADDFEELRATMAERWGPVRMCNGVTRVKSVFKYGVESGLIERSVRYGPEFQKPDKSVLRRHRAKNGERMIEANALQDLIAAADVQMRVMILLGVNAGFGNLDCATLPLSAVNLNTAWVNFPRPKTGIARRCWLWPETVEALRAVLAERPTPRASADADLVFLQATGRRWVRITEKSRTDNLSVHFMELLNKLDMHRDGLGFYSLRHVHRTVADGARDAVACDVIMGHSDPSMGGHYRERVEDQRLRAVAEHVRCWLFPAPAKIAARREDSAEEVEPSPAAPVATASEAPTGAPADVSANPTTEVN
jgi:integrase